MTYVSGATKLEDPAPGDREEQGMRAGGRTEGTRGATHLQKRERHREDSGKEARLAVVALFLALRLVIALGLRTMLFLVGGGRGVLIPRRAATLDLAHQLL